MNPANSQDALTQLQQTQAGAKSAADILNAQKQQYGVQAAQDTVGGLRSAITNTTRLLNQVAPSVMGRTANSLVTSAQANRQIANEQQPIAQNLSQQTQDYGNAQSDYEKALQEATTGANMEYGDQQNKLSYMQNLYNTLYQREENARQAAAQEAARQEQIRQFNEQLAASRKNAAAQLALQNRPTTISVGNNDQQAAILAEARRQASKMAAAEVPAAQAASKQARDQVNNLSGFNGFLNYIGTKGPMALFGL
jgi:hypothetical protein